uniref:Uncharacterized protein n=1 Tax=Ditylenchus dipsaci TaxID=166011 RepID=A0A915E634_9BILA
MDPVPVKEKKLKKDSRERTATLDLTGGQSAGQQIRHSTEAERFGQAKARTRKETAERLLHSALFSTHNMSQSTAQTKKPVPFDFCDDGNILWTFIPDGKNVAIKKIDRSRRTSCTNEHLLEGHFQSVTAIAYRRNRQELITSANDRLALIWTPKMDEERPEYEQKAVDLHKDEYSDED